MNEPATWWAIIMAGVCTAGAMALGYGTVRHLLGGWRVRYMLDAQAGLSEVFLFVAPDRIWRINLAACAGAAVATWLSMGSAPASLAAALLIAPLPRTLLGVLRRRRVARIDGQLPDAARGMSAALRAGASLPASLRWTAEHTPAPLSQEIGLMLREQRVGVTFADALTHLEARVDTEAVRLLAATLRVAATSGGDLSRLLEQFARLQRRRLQVDARIRTLTSQGRVQALVVGVLPIVLLVVLSFMSPDMMAVFWHTHEGWAVLGLIVMLEVCGAWLIRRIVRIRV